VRRWLAGVMLGSPRRRRPLCPRARSPAPLRACPPARLAAPQVVDRTRRLGEALGVEVQHAGDGNGRVARARVGLAAGVHREPAAARRRHRHAVQERRNRGAVNARQRGVAAEREQGTHRRVRRREVRHLPRPAAVAAAARGTRGQERDDVARRGPFGQRRAQQRERVERPVGDPGAARVERREARGQAADAAAGVARVALALQRKRVLARVHAVHAAVRVEVGEVAVDGGDAGLEVALRAPRRRRGRRRRCRHRGATHGRWRPARAAWRRGGPGIGPGAAHGRRACRGLPGRGEARDRLREKRGVRGGGEWGWQCDGCFANSGAARRGPGLERRRRRVGRPRNGRGCHGRRRRPARGRQAAGLPRVRALAAPRAPS
jgi:hypothetical protein